MGKTLADLKDVGVNKSQLTIKTREAQQAAHGQSNIVRISQPDEISLTLKNDGNGYVLFSLFKSFYLSRTNRPAFAGQTVVDDDTEDQSFICDLPAGWPALRRKLMDEKAVIIAVGMNVTADANVDNYTRANTFFNSYLKNLNQIDEPNTKLKNQVSANIQERTQLVWELATQANDNNDILIAVKPHTEMQLSLKISHYGITPFTAK
jgi:hypothetical protein